MNEKFIKKCNKVFETSKKIIGKKELLEAVEQLLQDSFSEEYVYLTSSYAGVFLKDQYEIYSKYKSPMADDYGMEPFLYFLGFEGENNLFSINNQYKNRIEGNYVPIAIADGDNLVCMKTDSGEIGLWIHDDRDKPYLIFDSIEEMIMMIKKRPENETGDGVKKMVMSQDFFDAVEAFKKGLI